MHRTILVLFVLSLLVPFTTFATAQPESIPATIEVRSTTLDSRIEEGDPCVGLNDLNRPIRLTITGDPVDSEDPLPFRLFGRAYLVGGKLICSAFVVTDLPARDSYEFFIPDIGSAAGFTQRISREEIEAGAVLIEPGVVAVRASPYANHLRQSLPDATSLLVIDMSMDPGADLYTFTFVEYGFADEASAEHAFNYLDDFYNHRSTGFLLDQDSNLQPFSIGEPGDQRAAYAEVRSDGKIISVALIRYGDRILEANSVTDQSEIAAFAETYFAEHAAAIDESTPSLLPQPDDLPEGWHIFNEPRDMLETFQVVPPPIPVGTPVSP